MGSKTPAISLPLLESIILPLSTACSSAQLTTLINTLSSLEARASVTTISPIRSSSAPQNPDQGQTNSSSTTGSAGTNPSSTASSSEVLSTYYASYILALILDDDLEEARYLSHRIDQSLLHNDPVVISAYTVLQSLWSRSFEGFYNAIMGAPWGEIVGVLAQRLLAHKREKTLALLSTAYTSIPPSIAGRYLGVADEAEIIKELTEKHGWEYDKSKGLLLPRTNENADRSRSGATEGEIGRLTAIVGHLSEL